MFGPFYNDYQFAKRPVFTNDLGDHPTFEFYTYDDGLDIPVFHVIPTQTDKDIAVCLFEPRFYQYTRNTNIYNHFLLDKFDEALREPYNSNMSNWEMLVKHWMNDHCGFGKSKLKDKISSQYNIHLQPDYTKLEEYPILKRGFKRAFIAKWNA